MKRRDFIATTVIGTSGISLGASLYQWTPSKGLMIKLFLLLSDQADVGWNHYKYL